MTDDDNGGKSLIVDPADGKNPVPAVGGGAAERESSDVRRTERAVLSVRRPPIDVRADPDRDSPDARTTS